MKNHTLSVKKASSFLLFGFLSLFSLLNAQPLSGDYTIGGTTPDYLTFNDAVTDLELNGVSAPVNFNVRTGNYEEQIIINSYPFSSDAYPVTFQSETGDKNDVILHHEHHNWSTNANYTIFIDGADHLLFKNLTIQANPESPTSINNNRVIYITGAANNILFENNRIKSWYTTRDYFEYNDCIVVGSDYIGSRDNNNISFVGNEIIGGCCGLYMQGQIESGNHFGGNWLVNNNIFIDQYRTGLEFSNSSGVTATNNSFTSKPGQNYFTGIYASGNYNKLDISNNKFSLSGGSTGIKVSSLKRTQPSVQQVVNNIISIGPDSIYTAPIGINTLYNDTLLVAHNTVNIYAETNLGYCIQSNRKDTVFLKNNMLSHMGGGLCYYSNDNSSSILITENNNLFNNGNTLAEFDGVSYSTLENLRDSLGTDMFSTTHEPYYVSNTLLIPFNPLAYETGTPLATVSSDYFGTPRSISSPDVGVYEGTVPNVDAGIVGSDIADYVACPNDSIPLYVTLKNFGINNLTSVEIAYGTVSTIENQVSWSGNLNQHEEEKVFLGYIKFEQLIDISFKAWSFNPNAQSDIFSLNDTIGLFKSPRLTGAYTIGETLRDFTSISDAVDALSKSGVCGPVVFSIDSGEYVEQVLIPKIPGSSATNTITFRSADNDSSKVLMKFSAPSSTTNYVVSLNGTEYITFNKMSFQALGYYDKTVISTLNGAGHNTFTNNVFISQGDNLMYVAGNSPYQADSNIISNNHFIGGDTQLTVSGTSSNFSSGNTITANIFEGNCYNSIVISGQKDLLFSDNTISGSRYGNDGVAMDISNCLENLIIEKNKFNVTANRDLVNNISNCHGNELYPIIIRNNFISTYGSDYSRCLAISGSSYVKLVNNNFNLRGNDTYILTVSSTPNLDIYNNVFNSTHNGRIYSFSNPSDTTLVRSDHNAFFTSRTDGFLYDGSFLSLPDWQNSLGLDQNSIFTNIAYTNDTNLHIINSVGLYKTGINSPNVLDDIDGDTRHLSTPCIGADEFEIDSTSYYDIQLVSVLSPDTTSCTKSDSLIIEVYSKSNFPITSFDVKLWAFETFSDSIHITQTIPPLESIIVNLGQFTFAPNTTYSIDFEIYNPNENVDNNIADNFMSVDYYHLDNAKIFKKVDEECSGNIELYLKSFSRDSVLWSTGSTEQSIIASESGSYSVTVTDNKGCKISDTIIIE